MTQTDTNAVYCSFCGKNKHDVRRLIQGHVALICDECTELCMDILREESGKWLANRNGEIGPCASEANLSLLVQSGYTVANLMEDGGVSIQNFHMLDQMDLKVTLARMASGVVQRLSIANGPEGTKARIAQMRGTLAQIDKEFDEAATAYRQKLVDRSEYSLIVQRLRALEDELARYEAAAAQVTVTDTPAT